MELPEIKYLPSWYDPTIELTAQQQEYLLLLTNTFRMRSETGQPIPYVPTKYQAQFHLESLNIKGVDAKDILYIKARGVSFTSSSCVDIITTASIFDNQTIPVIAQRQKASNYIVKLCKWFILNSCGNLKDQFEFKETELRNKKTGSVIASYPSGSAADSVRSLRLMRCLVDEYAFQNRSDELLAAVQDAMIGSLSQTIIGSTPYGRNNNFFRLVNKPVGFRVFNLPVYDPSKVDIFKPLEPQNLIPIAPWINVKKLETKRQRDIEIFKQEQMCLHPDTVVLGEKPMQIKNISIGDRILNRDGGVSIVKGILSRKISEECVKMQVWGGNEMSLTKNHPILSIKNNKSRREYLKISPEFRLAGELKPGDYILFPRLNGRRGIKSIRLSAYLGDTFIRSGDRIYHKVKWTKGNSLPLNEPKNSIYDEIPLNRDVLRLFGLYIAEGSAVGNQLRFGFSSSESQLISEVQTTIEMYFGKRASISNHDTRPTSTEVVCFNKLLHDVFRILFGIGAKNKHLPEFVWDLSRDQMMWLLNGCFDGDGCRTEKKYIYGTISERLAKEINLVLLMNNVYSSVHVSKDKRKTAMLLGRKVNRNPPYQIQIYGKSFERLSKFFGIAHQGVRHSKVFQFDKFDLLKIRTIDFKDYSGDVWNLDVDGDSTYLTEIGIVHNCSFLDDSLSFLPYSLIMQCIDNELKNYYEDIIKDSEFVFKTDNPMYIGIDVARSRDFTAVSLFEKTIDPEDGKLRMTQRFIGLLKNVSTPDQEALISSLFRHFPSIVKVRIDMTGVGTGLFDYLRRRHGSMVEGIQFSERVRSGQGGKRLPIIDRMATNMKHMMQDDSVSFIGDDLQVKHLNAVNYDFKADHKRLEGHADLFWANALALLKEGFRSGIGSTVDYSSTVPVPGPQKLPILEKRDTEELRKTLAQVTWPEKIAWMKRQARGSGRF